MNDDKTHTDGIVELLAEVECILVILKKDKNKFSDGSCDPSMQAGLLTACHWAQAKVHVYYLLCSPLTIEH